MRQVHVALHDDDGRRTAAYKGWVPDEYVARNLVVQVLLYWNVLGTTDLAACSLLPVAPNVPPAPIPLTTPLVQIPTSRFCLVVSPVLAIPRRVASSEADDERRVQMLFRMHALQNPWGRDGTTINWQQFKAMTRSIAPTPGRQTQWDTAQMVAFKTHAVRGVGLDLDKFLHAWAYLGQHYPRFAFQPCTSLQQVYTLIANNMGRPKLDSILDQCDDQAWLLRLHAVRKLLQRYAKSLHYLLSAFVPTTGSPVRVDFAAFQAFWAALRFGQHFFVTSEEVAAAFTVVASTNTRTIPVADSVHTLLHLVLLALPRLLPAMLPLATKASMATAHKDLLRLQTLDEAYPIVVVKLLVQHLVDRLTPANIAALSQRVHHAMAFRRGAHALHRAFLSMCQADGDCDYMEEARRSWLLERTSTTALVEKAATLLHSDDEPMSNGRSTADPLATADDLYANMLPQLARDDVDAAVEAWAAATELYDAALTRATVNGMDGMHASLLFRFGASLSVTAFQIAKAHPARASLALEIAHMASAKLHAYWAYLCLKSPDDERDDQDWIYRCVLEWANALALTGDLVASGAPDAALAARLASAPSDLGDTIELWSVPGDASRAVHYYEACRRYELALTMRPSAIVHDSYAHAKMQLVQTLPLGCLASRWMVPDLMDQRQLYQRPISSDLEALAFVTEAFSIERPSSDGGLVPLYAVAVNWIVATYGGERGGLSHSNVNTVNGLCGCPPVTESTMQWLCETFDDTPASTTLSSSGFQKYLAFLATASPPQFKSTMRLLVSHYQHHTAPLPNPTPWGMSLPASAPTYSTQGAANVARAFLVLSLSTPPCVERCIQAHMADTVPDQIALFCAPPAALLSGPRCVDTVLTDATGAAIYVSSLIIDNDASSAYAVVSSYPYFCLFHTVLRSVASAPTLPETALRAFLAETPSSTAEFLGVSIGPIPRPASFLPSQVDFGVLLQALSVDHILLVVLYVLSERHVIVCSSNPSLLTPICETLRALLSPFSSQAVYIPVLPHSLLDFLHAPVPYLMGVVTSESTDATLRGLDVIVVNVDVDAIAVPRGRHASLPTVPRKSLKRMASSVKSIADHHGLPLREATSPDAWREVLLRYGQADPHRSVESADAAWSALRAAFSAFHFSLIQGYEAFYEPATTKDDRPRFDAEGYLEAFPDKRGFGANFFTTQAFAAFLEAP
ncbi:hypothetical protein SDRG_16278 [Saprolegnia diclina VS20]|uniref:UDENN domain-containing protein n=1 Tax=Saprolegnia diclina (strain VS20) TaxID=1156394 RepID=T0R1F4_SAPDV|nr:hypothetical protein SDRG_16278 [Saprolegnia diclina VS20]EQC25828.1 hypothetical protein SDRG_16278 [Saprolegnia diclina VS20]|eukprot:XP_008620703.1 hypothetical protein SDRG_16278 [Saprolegnia diclina VS20]